MLTFTADNFAAVAIALGGLAGVVMLALHIATRLCDLRCGPPPPGDSAY